MLCQQRSGLSLLYAIRLSLDEARKITPTMALLGSAGTLLPSLHPLTLFWVRLFSTLPRAELWAASAAQMALTSDVLLIGHFLNTKLHVNAS